MLSSIYLKPTNYCNVGCKHCYLTGKTRSEFYFMTKENIDIIYEKLEEYYSSLKTNIRGDIILHGGEPLLNSIEILEYICKKFNNYEISIQTSLFPLFDLSKEERKKYYQLFKKYDIGIGMSYDFFGTRQYKHSTELFEKKFLEIANEIVEHNIKKTFLLFTITKKIQGREEEVYNWLLKYKDLFLGVNYEEYNEYNNFNKNLYLKNSEMADILIKLYKLDKKNSFKVFLRFYEIEENMKKKRYLPGKFCSSCETTHLTIEPNGNITSCPDKGGMPNEVYGNIYKQDLFKILMNKKRVEWLLINKQTYDICNDCEFKYICKGGCPLKKKIFIDKKILNKNECPGYYSFLKFVEENIDK